MKNLVICTLLLPSAAFSAEGIEERFADLEQRVSDLESRLGGTNSASAPSLDLSSITPGTYFLETANVGSINEDDSGYVIYHAMTTVKTGATQYGIQFGAGRKGLVNWQFYVDYDNDGVVDMDFIDSFFDSLPLMGVFSSSVDPQASQRIYELLVSNIEVATHTPPEQIAEDASVINQQIWEYVQTQSVAMAEWIKLNNP